MSLGKTLSSTECVWRLHRVLGTWTWREATFIKNFERKIKGDEDTQFESDSLERIIINRFHFFPLYLLFSVHQLLPSCRWGSTKDKEIKWKLCENWCAFNWHEQTLRMCRSLFVHYTSMTSCPCCTLCPPFFSFLTHHYRICLIRRDKCHFNCLGLPVKDRNKRIPLKTC